MSPTERVRSDSPSPETGQFYFDQRSEKIFDRAFGFFGILDIEGRIQTLSGRLFQRTNIDTNLLVGQRFSETVFWQSSENTARLVEKAVAEAVEGIDVFLLLDFRVSAEEKIPVELQLLLLREDDASTQQIFVSGRALREKDPTSRPGIENEQLLWAAENAGIGLWFWDIRDERIYSTPSCNELLGLPTYDPITFESFLTVVHADDRSRVENLFQRLQRASSRYEEEFRVTRSDGTVEWISAQGRSISNGGDTPVRMMGIVRNVTEQRIASEELSRVYDREKRARDEAVEANRAKDFFLAFVSHELRSPLNAILGWAKILLTKTVDDKTRQNALETIERSARLQTKLINDLVDSARVASGKLRLEFHPTNLCEVVRGAYQAQKPTADAHKVEFNFSSDCEEIVVFGDAGRLQQVFTNLISNALKFTPDEGTISVEIRLAAETVSVHVKDTGQGIAADALPNIFRQFSQGELGRSRTNTGLGLGLSIVKILVNKHRGAVSALSDGPGRGSEFVVTLPLSDSKPVALEVSGEVLPTKGKPLSDRRILVVEDDADSREVLQLFLEQSGAKVASAESAKVAMELLTRSANGLPDVIISDLAMPDEDGYSLLLRIRQLSPDNGGTIPAIALSAFTTAESKQKAFESGFQIYSTKPFEPDRLVADILQLTASSS
ncbi:MAG TPA: ATP-binding protein [Pyrinomonadaceae bacterium]|nr:ATP-binding protein [Pyrinomonadaceae bacterium]